MTKLKMAPVGPPLILFNAAVKEEDLTRFNGKPTKSPPGGNMLRKEADKKVMTANDWKCQWTLIRICRGLFLRRVRSVQLLLYRQFVQSVQFSRTNSQNCFHSGAIYLKLLCFHNGVIYLKLLLIFPTFPSSDKSVQSKDCCGDQFKCVSHFKRYCF